MTVHAKALPTAAVVVFVHNVDGLTRASCFGRVERALEAVSGVEAACGNRATEHAADDAALERDLRIDAVPFCPDLTLAPGFEPASALTAVAAKAKHSCASVAAAAKEGPVLPVVTPCVTGFGDLAQAGGQWIAVRAGAPWPAFGPLFSSIFAAAALALSLVFVLGNALLQRADTCGGGHRRDCPIPADPGLGATRRTEQVRSQFYGHSSLRTASRELYSQ